jgi:uncharacterized damage-inducible protein DinB
MSFFTEFESFLGTHHDSMRASIQDLPGEALDWSSNHVRNSLVVLTCHVTGSERFWMGNVIANDPHPRDRDAEFRMQGVAESELRERIGNAESYSVKVLATLAEADLGSARVFTWKGKETRRSVGWVLLHVLEHTAYHAGQMNLIRKTWLDRSSS